MKGTRRQFAVLVGSLAIGALALAPRSPAPSGDPVDDPGFFRPGAGEDWWAYQPLVRPGVPGVEDRGWPANPIDAFILAKLEGAGLEPAPPADRVAMLRRATYDLTGLPPTPEEVDAFLADGAPGAYERLVERLLASAHYGEKWGRHWLDLVRYAETDSFERDRVKPNAWRYRDYVIDAFNADMAYDRFITEQLAGDEIATPTLESVIATGYHRLGIWDDEPTDLAQAQFDDLDGIVDTTARVMLGISIGCARCHDHKRDPIPQADYYRLLAFFRGIEPYKAQAGNDVTRANFTRTVATGASGEDVGAALERHERAREGLLGRIREIERAALAGVGPETAAGLAGGAAEGLVAAYAFDEGDPGASAIPGVPAAELSGTGVEPDGVRSGAISFDGGNGGARFPRPIGDDFTVSFWFRTTDRGSGAGEPRWFDGDGLVDAEVGGETRDFGVSHHSDGRIVAGTGGPDVHVASGAGYNDGRWHHVAFTRHRASGAVALYVDGSMAGSVTGSTARLDAAGEISLGRLQTGPNPFRGSLDELLIYERVLDEGEVLDLYLDTRVGRRPSAVLRDALARAGTLEAHAGLLADLGALDRPRVRFERVLCVREAGPEAPATHVLIRGNAGAPGDEVVPGYPLVLGGHDASLPAPGEASSRRRLALAGWITGAGNPATARVMVNRIWQHHFGRGLVRTPNDFGRLGERPTHPELLDWLGAEFIARGWSVKEMHRLIMTSRAYRMSSSAHPRGSAVDPANDLFWRFDMRRLTAEEIRDSILSVNGTLNRKMGGAGVYPPMPEEVLATSSRPEEAWGFSAPEEAARRSIYIHVKRSLVSPLLASFDLADTDSTCPVRFATTQPTQALTMLNSDFIAEQASLLARRLRAEAGPKPRDQIALALRLTRGDEPGEEEIARGLALLDELRAEEGLSSEGAMDAFCLLVLNLNEFVYLE